MASDSNPRLRTLILTFLTICFLFKWLPTEAHRERINGPDCGISQPLGRIINGSSIAKTQVPWMVLIVATTIDLKGYMCGGSIITRNVILTAAHCVYNSSEPPNLRFEVFYNTTKINSHHLGPRIPVIQGLVHKKYEHPEKGYDIALLKLRTPLPKFDKFVRPVCLPLYGAKTPKKNLLVAGYGSINYQEQLAEEVLYMFMAKLPKKKCCRFFKSCPKGWPRWTFCTNNPHQSPFKGDSGSPLTASTRRGKGTKSVAFGIVSFGSKRGRDGIAPAVFTRISLFVKWIEKSLKRIRSWKSIIIF